MNIVHAHSDLNLWEIEQYFPGDVRLLIPCGGGMPEKAPHLLIVQGPGSYQHLQTLIKSAEIASNGAIVSLPHPRNSAPLTDKQIAALQKHLPAIKKGQAMKDALSLAFSICPSPTLDPDLFCF